MILFLLLLTAAVPVYAYLDPGTGSMLLQVILGGLAAVGVVLKLYWHKIVRALGVGPKPEPNPDARAKDETT
jgi:hypothetical protein